MMQWWKNVKKEYLRTRESITEEVRRRLKASYPQFRYPADQGILAAHNFTENFRQTAPDWKNIPSVFKKTGGEKIFLPQNFPERKMSVAEAIRQRTSRRHFSEPLKLAEISEVLYFANGFKGFLDQGKFGLSCKTTAPSAGSRHPLEMYGVLDNVQGVEKGVYHFDAENHALEKISQNNLSREVVLKMLHNQERLIGANFFFLTAVYERTAWKYGPRSYRFIHLDAGHVGQNVYLIGEAMGLSVCAIGNWDRQLVKEILHLDEQKEITVYALAVGKK
jgi:SagB-type dehydrogenase family enzyme